MKFKMYALLALCALVTVGCAPAKMDTSSDAALKASVEKMTAGMSAAEGKAFAEECMLAVTIKPNGELNEVVVAQALGGKQASPAELLKPLHGMTMEEIKAKAAEVRKKQQAAAKP